MSSSRSLSAILLCSLLALAACHEDDDDDDDPPPVSQPTSSFDCDVARQWFNLLIGAIDAENYSPPVASRTIAYSGVTLYESVVGGMDTHNSLAGQLNGLDSVPALPSGVLHWPSVANSALATILENLFASASAPTLATIATLEQSLADVYDDTVSAAVVQRSIDYGEDVGLAVFTWSTGDGFSMWNNCAYTVPVGPGLWAPTPPAFTPNPLQPCWGNLRPFALLFGAECAPLAHPPYSTDTGSVFYQESLEVYNTVNNLTQAQMDIALFWADGSGSLTPPGHWISIVDQICAQEALTLDVAAEAYAKVGIGVADAFISCWELKYYYNLLRPITYVRDAAGPINDPTWNTFIGTPPFPEYTSGHSTQSGAAAFLLEDLLGDITFTDHTHDAVPLNPRTFDTFAEAANEAAISRLYGGIHYRAAIERGIEQGQCIGAVILDNVQFRN